MIPQPNPNYFPKTQPPNTNNLCTGVLSFDMSLGKDILTMAKGLFRGRRGVGTVWLLPRVTFERDQCL